MQTSCRSAKTGSQRQITYDPVNRPEVSSLVLLAALCLEREPHAVAEEFGDAGAAALKAVLIDAINERLRPMRGKRRDLMQDRGYLREVLADGAERCRAIATETLDSVRGLMHTTY